MPLYCIPTLVLGQYILAPAPQSLHHTAVVVVVVVVVAVADVAVAVVVDCSQPLAEDLPTMSIAHTMKWQMFTMLSQVSHPLIYMDMYTKMPTRFNL